MTAELAAPPVTIPAPGLFVGRVSHARLTPFRHAFRYRVFSLLVDIDRLAEMARGLRLFAYNATGLLSFHDRDHGPRDGSPLRPWVEAQAARQGLDLAGGAIRLLCFPRILGYVFNPLSVYFCYRRAGGLAALLYEVKNTFGDQHGYLVPVSAGEDGRIGDHARSKSFYVSPFLATEGGYRFRLSEPHATLDFTILQRDGAGAPILVARHAARRRPLSDRALALSFLSHPLMTLKVMAAIHWEALFLWAKGARFHHRPAPPAEPVTLDPTAIQTTP